MGNRGSEFVQAFRGRPCSNVRSMSGGPNSVRGSAASERPGRVHADSYASVLRLGAVVSVVQSVLFVVIGVAALLLGVDRLVADGFASLPSADATVFRILCGAFIGIAVLGLAITPAERALIEPIDAGWAGLGARFAYLGHAATIAFFSWWLLKSFGDADSGADLDPIAPIEWGVMFELVFVGAWVWVIAGVAAFGRLALPRGFLPLSVAKATSFWFAFSAFLTKEEWMLILGVGAVTFLTGPSWHLWISRIFLRSVREHTDPS